MSFVISNLPDCSARILSDARSCWFHANVQRSVRYAAPSIENGRYEKFIAAVCPAVTGTRHSALAALIKSLDLSRLVYDGKSSDTARLLNRTAPNLVRFVAPAVKFGCNCFTALAKCCKLQVLDLRLVKPSIQLEDLLRHIRRLKELRTLIFPRSVTVPDYEAEQTSLAGYVLPENLECFSLTGSISDTFLTTLIAPESLVEFRIFDAFARYMSIRFLLNKWSTQLKVLEVNYHISTLPHNAMDKILVTCPNLEKLRVAVDFITHRLFDEENAPLAHPLKRLDLDSSGYPGAEHKLKADHIFICLAEGRLSCLRIVRLSEKLNWVAKDKEGVDDLVQVLETRIDATNGVAGVWEFGSTSRKYGAF